MKWNSFVRITINWPFFYKRKHNWRDGQQRVAQVRANLWCILQYKKDLKTVICCRIEKPVKVEWLLGDALIMHFNSFTNRSNYVAACYAAKMMVPAKQGLIVNVSSAGGMRYLFNVAYGTGKAAVSEPKGLSHAVWVELH